MLTSIQGVTGSEKNSHASNATHTGTPIGIFCFTSSFMSSYQ